MTRLIAWDVDTAINPDHISEVTVRETEDHKAEYCITMYNGNRYCRHGQWYNSNYPFYEIGHIMQEITKGS